MKFQYRLSTKQIQSIILIILSFIIYYILRFHFESAGLVLLYVALIMFAFGVTNLFDECMKRYKILRAKDTEDYDSPTEEIVADYFKRKNVKFYLHPKVKVPTKIWRFNNPFKKRTLKPDFFLPQYNAFVEYWGNNGEDYERKRKLKEKAYNENDIEFISLSKRDLIYNGKLDRNRLDWNFTQKLLDLIREREGNNLEWKK